MATFNNGESGSSVRTKINAVLQHTDGTAGELVINEAGADVDFRVESDTNANALFVDGATGNVGIGTAGPAARLDIRGGNGIGVRYIETDTGNTNRIQLGTGSGFGYIDATAGAGSTALVFQVASTERLRIDSSGNLGLGATPSASNLATIQSSYGIFSGNSQINIAQNAYYNSGWKYTGTAAASLYFQGSGAHSWQIAASGTAGNAITFTQAMTLDASGNLLIGTTSSGGSKLRISGLPTSSAGLSAGDVWNDGGTLKIA